MSEKTPSPSSSTFGTGTKRSRVQVDHALRPGLRINMGTEAPSAPRKGELQVPPALRGTLGKEAIGGALAAETAGDDTTPGSRRVETFARDMAAGIHGPSTEGAPDADPFADWEPQEDGSFTKTDTTHSFAYKPGPGGYFKFRKLPDSDTTER